MSATPLAAGNAVRLNVSLLDGASFMRVLRLPTDTFSGPDDPNAMPIIDDFAGETLIDTEGLTNGTTYFYRSYDWVESAFVDSGISISATPNANYIADAVDPQELLRDRLQLGINVEIVRSQLKPETGKIAVITAPFAMEGTTFPVISVILDNTGPSERVLGDQIEGFHDPSSNQWVDTNGWIARFSMSISAATFNLDERIQLRKSVRRVIQANLPIFNEAGMVQIELNQTDAEIQTDKSAVIYVSNATFTCLAPAFIQVFHDVVTDVTVSAEVLTP